MKAEVTSRGEKVRQKARSAIDTFLLFLQTVVEAHTVIGAGLIIMALSMFEKQPTGIIANMASWGISPRGFAVATAICGALILRYPKSAYYGILTMPILFYAAVTFDYVLDTDSSWTPVVITVVLWLLALQVGTPVKTPQTVAPVAPAEQVKPNV